MEKRRLGSTELMVSAIGFGGIPIQRVDEKTVIQIFGALIEEGINFIDTARGYTISESLIGAALKEYGRERFILATKTMKRDYYGTIEEFETSIGNLGTEYVELYQFHNVRTKEEFETIIGENGAYSAAIRLKEAGKLKHIGITSHNADLLKMIIESGLFETVQFPFNAVENQAEESFKLAIERDMGVIVMKPLAGGAIMNKELALRYTLEKPFVTSLIPGMDSADQVHENAKIGNHFKPLTPEERAILSSEVKELGQKFCRRCGYCAPCPVGIDIPVNFLMEGYYTRYNLKEWAKERYEAMQKKASDCIQCGTCETRCPYDLEIISMLENVDNIFSKA